MEEKIKECVSKRLARGRLEIRLFINDAAEETFVYQVNLAKAKAYHQALSSLAQTMGMTADIPLNLLVGAQGLITPGEAAIDYDGNWVVIERCLLQALEIWTECGWWKAII